MSEPIKQIKQMKQPLTLEELAWNYTLQMNDFVYDEADNCLRYKYTGRAIIDGTIVPENAHRVAAIMLKYLTKYCGEFDAWAFYNLESLLVHVAPRWNFRSDRLRKEMFRAATANITHNPPRVVVIIAEEDKVS